MLFKIFGILAVLIGLGGQFVNIMILPFNSDLTFMLMPIFTGGGFFFVMLMIIVLIFER